MSGGNRLHPVFGATLWMTGTLASFTLMAVSGRELSVELNTFQILFWRSLVGLIVVSALLSWYGWSKARTAQPGIQVMRNLIHFCGQFGWFYAIAHITLAEVFAIEFTVPIWSMVLAAIFLSEVITATRVLALILGFAGVLIILRPGFSAVEAGHFAVLGAAFAYAVAYVTTKQLVKTDTALAVMFYMTLVQLPLGLAFGLDGWAWPSPESYIWVFLVGVSGLSAHFCIAQAMRLADATIVVPMDFLRLPLVAVVGALFYAEVVEVWVFVGALIIMFGNLLNVRAERRRSAAE